MNHNSRIITEDIARIADDLKSLSSRLEGKTILIAGGAGFLGRYMVAVLQYLDDHVLTKPCKIIILDNFISGLKENVKNHPHTTVIQQDISKPFTVTGHVDYMMHAASIASPIFYNQFRIETIDVGILGTKHLLELAREKNVASFLFFSSSEVYGNPDASHIPTREDYNGNVSCIGPRACYDEPKRMGETICMAYADKFNIPVKIVRPFNIYGPGMRLDDGRVMPNFAVSALKGERIPVYGEGVNTRTFCYISDAITGIYQVLLSDMNREVYNIGSDENEIPMKLLADLVHGLVENETSNIQNVESPHSVYSKLSDPQRRCPDLTRIRTQVGYRPRVSLISGLKRFITWVKEELESRGGLAKLEKACRNCGEAELTSVISLGKSPLANNLVKEAAQAELFPLEMMRCKTCNLCQLSYVAPPEKMFKNYLYVSSTTDTFKRHFTEMAGTLVRRLNLGSISLVVDVGSNDGLLLSHFKARGVKTLGVEPAENLAKLAHDNGIETINGFFDSSSSSKIVAMHGKADLITATNVFAHVGDIKSFVHNVLSVLSPSGVFCIEVQYLLDTLEKLSFDNIYHEHLSYFSVMTLQDFFKRNGMDIFHVEHVDTHGGSIRVYVQRAGGPRTVEQSVEEAIQAEKKAGLDKPDAYTHFAQQVYGIRSAFQNFISNLKKDGKKIAGYGAPAKATTFLNFCGVNTTQIDYVVEDNALKQGFIIPGTGISIVGKERLEKDKPDYIAVLAWNFADEIVKKNESLRGKGVQFFVPAPEPKLI